MTLEQVKILYDFQESGYKIISEAYTNNQELIHLATANWLSKGNWSDAFPENYQNIMAVPDSNNDVYVLVDQDGDFWPIDRLPFEDITIWKNEKLNLRP